MNQAASSRSEEENMQGYNCIMVFDKEEEHLLFCKRLWDPYEGKYNLVGGKIDEGEDGFHAAYRELCEETGITDEDIELIHMMKWQWKVLIIHMIIFILLLYGIK